MKNILQIILGTILIYWGASIIYKDFNSALNRVKEENMKKQRYIQACSMYFSIIDCEKMFQYAVPLPARGD